MAAAVVSHFLAEVLIEESALIFTFGLTASVLGGLPVAIRACRLPTERRFRRRGCVGIISLFDGARKIIKNRKRENRGKVERIWGEKERLRGRERSRDRKDLEKTSGEKNRLWKKMGES